MQLLRMIAHQMYPSGLCDQAGSIVFPTCRDQASGFLLCTDFLTIRANSSSHRVCRMEDRMPSRTVHS